VQVLNNATISGTIYITLNTTHPSSIVIITASSMTIGNVTVSVSLSSPNSCEKITGTAVQVGNQLITVFNTVSTCGSNYDIIIGISASIGSAILVTVIVVVSYFIVMAIKKKKQTSANITAVKNRAKRDDNII